MREVFAKFWFWIALVIIIIILAMERGYYSANCYAAAKANYYIKECHKNDIPAGDVLPQPLSPSPGIPPL